MASQESSFSDAFSAALRLHELMFSINRLWLISIVRKLLAKRKNSLLIDLKLFFQQKRSALKIKKINRKNFHVTPPIYDEWIISFPFEDLNFQENIGQN